MKSSSLLFLKNFLQCKFKAELLVRYLIISFDECVSVFRDLPIHNNVMLSTVVTSYVAFIN